MPDEIDVTIQTVETLLESIEEDVTISILFNGGSSAELSALFNRIDCVRYYESPQNLGVAGGRNFLLGRPECRDADIVFILDNDVVPPLDYVRNLSTFLVQREDAGVVGAMVADIQTVPYQLVKNRYGDRGRFGNRIFRLTSASIRNALKPKLSSADLFHIGIHPDYRVAYFSIRPLIYKLMRFIFSIFKIQVNFSPILKNNSAYLSLIKAGVGHYRVSNLAGCSQAFRRELVDKIGALNDLFNPYGYEDSEFCVRSLKAGYHNYIDTHTWLYHGTDARHKNRDSDSACENQIRGLTTFAALVFPHPVRYRLVILKLIFFDFVVEFFQNPGRSKKRLKLKWEGYRQARKILDRNLFSNRKTAELSLGTDRHE